MSSTPPSSTTVSSTASPGDDEGKSTTVSTSIPSVSPEICEIETPKGEKDPTKSLRNVSSTINQSPVSQLETQPALSMEADADDAECSTPMLTEKQPPKATMTIDMVPKNAIIGDTQLLQLSSAIGNNSNFLKLGLKLKFTNQQSRDYKRMNYTGGDVSQDGTTKMLFDWKKRSNGYVRDLYSALHESELVAIADEELLRNVEEMVANEHIRNLPGNTNSTSPRPLASTVVDISPQGASAAIGEVFTSTARFKNLTMASPKRVVSRVLLVFACDHTIIEGCTDTWILSLLPDHKIPIPFKKQYNSWTICMGDVFKYMHSVDMGEAAIYEIIAGIPLTPGMKELFDYQASCSQLDCIVVSDSNSFFIDAILGSRNFQKGVSKIYTNQAEFDSDGCLKIHFSNPHSCPRKCPQNLCKQTCLQAFVEEQKAKGIEYDRVCMIGDRENDFCPCFCLKERDYVFPRMGFSLFRLLQEQKDKKGSNDECIKATVVPWDTATEILAVVKGFFEH